MTTININESRAAIISTTRYTTFSTTRQSLINLSPSHTYMMTIEELAQRETSDRESTRPPIHLMASFVSRRATCDTTRREDTRIGRVRELAQRSFSASKHSHDMTASETRVITRADERRLRGTSRAIGAARSATARRAGGRRGGGRDDEAAVCTCNSNGGWWRATAATGGGGWRDVEGTRAPSLTCRRPSSPLAVVSRRSIRRSSGTLAAVDWVD